MVVHVLLLEFQPCTNRIGSCAEAVGASANPRVAASVTAARRTFFIRVSLPCRPPATDQLTRSDQRSNPEIGPVRPPNYRRRMRSPALLLAIALIAMSGCGAKSESSGTSTGPKTPASGPGSPRDVI